MSALSMGYGRGVPAGEEEENARVVVAPGAPGDHTFVLFYRAEFTRGLTPFTLFLAVLGVAAAAHRAAGGGGSCAAAAALLRVSRRTRRQRI